MVEGKILHHETVIEIPGLSSDTSPVTDIRITAPDAGKSNTINVLYCFDSEPEQDKEYSYIYNDLPSKDGKLGIKLPFAGAILLDPSYEVIKVDLLNLYFAMNKDDGATTKY